MDYVQFLAEDGEFVGCEAGAFVGLDAGWTERVLVEHVQEFINDLVGFFPPELVGPWKAAVPVDHDEVLDSVGLEDVDADLLEWCCSVPEFQFFFAL